MLKTAEKLGRLRMFPDRKRPPASLPDLHRAVAASCATNPFSNGMCTYIYIYILYVYNGYFHGTFHEYMLKVSTHQKPYLKHWGSMNLWNDHNFFQVDQD